VIENSLDHREPANPLDAMGQFAANDPVPYADLLLACRLKGFVYGGFATDVLVRPPFLGIPSILDFDPTAFGAVLLREKKVSRLSLAKRPEVFDAEIRHRWLANFLSPTFPWEVARQQLQRWYPFPEIPSAQQVAKQVVADITQ
jgi:hypothetical protein